MEKAGKEVIGLCPDIESTILPGNSYKSMRPLRVRDTEYQEGVRGSLLN